MKCVGSFVAIISPFHSNGMLDSLALEKLVEWHIEQGTDGLVCCGATGESTCLNYVDRKRITEICIKTSAGRIPIIVGTGTPNTKETVKLTEKALEMGASGCLVITPFYNKPSQRGCVLHYREVAKVGLPVIVYHNPGRTQVRLTLETLTEIGNIPGVVGLKESSSDKELIRKLRAVSSLAILSGEDDLTYETIQMGGSGAISTVGNIIPRAWREMIHLCLEGKWQKAQIINENFRPLYEAIFTETNPQCVKYVLSLMKKCSPTLRLPLVLPLKETQLRLKKVLLGLSLPFRRQSLEKKEDSVFV